MHKKGKFVANSNQFEICGSKHLFFLQKRAKMCKSLKPNASQIKAEGGDYSMKFYMKHFFNGFIDMTSQTNSKGCVILSIEDSAKMRQYDNPLRDAVVIVKDTNDKYKLRDGFHRIYEALARKYVKHVHAIIIDMNYSDDSEIDD